MLLNEPRQLGDCVGQRVRPQVSIADDEPRLFELGGGVAAQRSRIKAASLRERGHRGLAEARWRADYQVQSR